MANYDELKKVLFGNQKQGDAINMVVAKIVGDTVAENTPEGEWPQRIEQYVKSEINKEYPNLMVLALIFGVNVFGVKDFSNAEIFASQPYPDSPKWVFELMTNTGDMISMDLSGTKSALTEAEESLFESKTEYSADDHVSRAQAEKDKIYPLVPASIKSCFEGEIGEWQASLLFAAQYYG